MLGGGDVTGWVVEHVIAKVEGEALARIKGEEYSRKRYTKPRQFLSDIGTEMEWLILDGAILLQSGIIAKRLVLARRSSAAA